MRIIILSLVFIVSCSSTGEKSNAELIAEYQSRKNKAQSQDANQEQETKEEETREEKPVSTEAEKDNGGDIFGIAITLLNQSSESISLNMISDNYEIVDVSGNTYKLDMDYTEYPSGNLHPKDSVVISFKPTGSLKKIKKGEIKKIRCILGFGNRTVYLVPARKPE